MKLVFPRWHTALGIASMLFVGIQVVPYGRDHANPPVVREPLWASPETGALVKRACYDCHSNETRWPSYAKVAPMSWLVQHDVDEGREHLDFSEWHRPQDDAKEAPEVVREGEMPLLAYRLIHSGARLTDAEREQLARGLEATLRTGGGNGDESR